MPGLAGPGAEFMPIQIIHRGGRLGLKGWVFIVLSLALAFALVFAVALVALGIFLFLLPVIALAMAASALMWLFGRRRNAGPGRSDIIDAEYRIVDETTPGRTQQSDGER